MRAQTILAAAILLLESAIAHPTVSHAHLHKLKLRDVLSKRVEYDTSHVNWDDALKDVDWDAVFGKKGEKGAPKTSEKLATTTDDDSPAPSASSSSSSDSDSDSSSGSTGGSGSCLDATKLSKRATTQQDSYLGNAVGNIHPESNCKSSGDYSLTFVNKMGSKKTFWLWNKAGTGTSNNPNGMMIDANKIFDLEDGQSTTFTFDKNSLMGFSQACGRATNFGNVPACNVGEASFADGNTAGGSDGGSFYDVSLVPYTQITAGGGQASKIPMTISADGYDSSSLTQCNYIQPEQNSPGNFPSGKSGCNIGPRNSGPLHATVTFG